MVLNNVYIKDESCNPTGTHKDRMAWEIIVTYRQIIVAKEKGFWDGEIPSVSMISSGSAAISVQTLLVKYKLPPLRVLVDSETDEETLLYLEKIGCIIYTTDLSKKSLDTKDILALTENKNGFDITSNLGFDPFSRFYDWLSFEILNFNPDYIFVPFGTGQLFENILNKMRDIVTHELVDPRYFGNKQTVSTCNIMGATAKHKKSLVAPKLYSPHSPFLGYDDQYLRLYKYSGFCGQKSGVFSVQDSSVEKAVAIADSCGLSYEISALAGLALFLENKEFIDRDKRILIINTGKTKMY